MDTGLEAADGQRSGSTSSVGQQGMDPEVEGSDSSTTEGASTC